MKKKLQGPALAKALQRVRMVIFDFDGVMTDNRVWVSQDGTEIVACNRSDGLGVGFLRKLGIPMAIVSTEQNPVVHRRAEKLKIECFAPCEDKLVQTTELLKRHGLKLEDAAFIGNDVNDLEILKRVGLPVVVQDAYQEVKRVASLVLKQKGGHGAVREFCDLLLASQSKPVRTRKTK